jgi:enoyl-CoA hydratase/carnithine racemase
MSDAVQYEEIGAVARLTLNRPEAMNALSVALIDALEQRLDQIAARDDLRVVVLTGSGRAFCAGADLKEVLAGADLPPADFLDRGNVVFGKLRNFSKPVIAALNGMTMAGGLELAMCADVVVAGESAKVGDAHANFGGYPGAGGAAVLPRLIPLNMALYLLFTGKTLSAAEMKALGLVCEVHPELCSNASLRSIDLLTSCSVKAKPASTMTLIRTSARASG